MAEIVNPARARLAAGELSLGVGMRLARSVEIARMMKSCGFDWLFIDLEHGLMSLDHRRADLGRGARCRHRADRARAGAAVRHGGARARRRRLGHRHAACRHRRGGAGDCRASQIPAGGHRSSGGMLPHLGYRAMNVGRGGADHQCRDAAGGDDRDAGGRRQCRRHRRRARRRRAAHRHQRSRARTRHRRAIRSTTKIVAAYERSSPPAAATANGRAWAASRPKTSFAPLYRRRHAHDPRRQRRARSCSRLRRSVPECCAAASKTAPVPLFQGLGIGIDDVAVLVCGRRQDHRVLGVAELLDGVAGDVLVLHVEHARLRPIRRPRRT